MFFYGFFGHGSIGNHDLRDIAGIYQDGSGTHGFIRKRGKFGSIDVPAASKTVVVGINRQRQLVGLFQDDTGVHGFNRNAGWGDSGLSVADVMGSTSPFQSKPGVPSDSFAKCSYLLLPAFALQPIVRILSVPWIGIPFTVCPVIETEASPHWIPLS